MTLYEVHKQLMVLYSDSLRNNSPFFDRKVGDLRISVTHKQASILSTNGRMCVMMLLDVSEYGREVDHKILFSDRHGKTSSSVEIANSSSNDFEFITDIPMYLPPGTKMEYPRWNIDDISEEFIFQQSTMHNLLEYKYYDQIKRYFNDISCLNRITQTSCMMHLDYDWDNIPLTQEDFQ